MAVIFPSNANEIQIFATGLFGVEVGSTTLAQVSADILASGGLNNTLNQYFSAAFGSMTTTAVATQIASNVGLTGAAATSGIAAITAALNGAAPSARGVVVLNLLNTFLGMTSDATYGTFATAYAANVNTALAYTGTTNQVAGTANALLPSTNTLTASADNVAVGSNSSVSGTANGANSTFTSGDVIAGSGTGNTLNLSDIGTGGTWYPATLGGVSISGMQTANLTSGEAVTVDTTSTGGTQGWTGLTSLVVSQKGGGSITTAATTGQTVYEASQATNSLTSNGGSTVTITANGGTTGVTSVGASTAPVGAVSVTANQLIAAAGVGGNVTVKGGSTVSITNLTSGLSAGSGATEGNITVTGAAAGTVNTTGTTSVSVTQSPDAFTIAAAAANRSQAATAGQAGNILGTVTITDANGLSATAANTISTVTLKNSNTATITSSALTNLNLAGNITGGATAVTINNNAAKPTNTTLNLGLTGLTVSSSTAFKLTNTTTKPTIIDTNNEITTLNVNLSGNSSIQTFTDTNLTTLNVTGSGILTLSAAPASLTSISVSGAAGLSTDISGLLPITSINASGTTSPMTLTLNGNQGFTGGNGVDQITLTADALKPITAGNASVPNSTTTTNVLTFNAGAGTFTANTVKNATGFTTFGTGASTSGTFDLSVFTGFNAISIASGTGTVAFKNAPTNLPITFGTTATSVTYTEASTTGLTDAATIVWNATNASAANNNYGAITTLALADSALPTTNGIGTVNITTNGVVGAIGQVSTITTLTDVGLSTLNVSGNAGLAITNAITGMTASIVTLNDNSTVQNLADGTAVLGLNLGGITDSSLTTLNFTGAGKTTITTLNNTSNAGTLTINDSASGAVTITTATVSSATGLVVNNTGSAALSIPTLTDTAAVTASFNNTGSGSITAGGTAGTGAALAVVNLNGAVTFTESAMAVTTGIRVNGATDNNAVTLTLSGITGAGVTDTITLGNGTDSVTYSAASLGIHNVTFGSGTVTYSEAVTIAGVANINLGTGSATVTLGPASNTMTAGSFTVTAPAHGGVNTINISNAGTNVATTPNLVYTGAQIGDLIVFRNDSGVTAINTITPAATVAATITALEATTTNHNVFVAVVGGNTYVSDAAGAAFDATHGSLIQLAGVHTFTISGTGLAVAS